MTALSASLGWAAPNLVSYYNDFWVFTMSRRQISFFLFFFCVCLFALSTQAYDTNVTWTWLSMSGNVCYFRHYVPIFEKCNYRLSADCIVLCIDQVQLYSFDFISY
jgi:hypothetical protein